ncbi:hypothetical protein [Phytohabitans aurantiacus]|jgi:hypothetical protein|uniref:Uncharacterized protein n=1 Tax=Phytohabitans aurantiacus TaxID=3016789 RepID=A0ABQ5R6B6_9ACTN|nr:hypothetical protein [Phytohabitans aurantiacus]GLI01422.1 hypothetical protein Pa4123_66980 [Phytohabitans aurantiacus]
MLVHRVIPPLAVALVAVAFLLAGIAASLVTSAVGGAVPHPVTLLDLTLNQVIHFDARLLACPTVMNM